MFNLIALIQLFEEKIYHKLTVHHLCRFKLQVNVADMLTLAKHLVAWEQNLTQEKVESKIELKTEQKLFMDK